MKSIIILIITLLLLYINSIAQQPNEEQNTRYNSTSLILKFKPGSSLLSIIRNLVPKNYYSKLEFDDIGHNNARILKEFMSTYKIQSIKAVKPDATLEHLAGGIERIFIIEITTENKPEVIKFLLNKNNHVEYAELDYEGYGNGTIKEESAIFTPNDPSFPQQWGLLNTGQNINGFNGTPGGDINAVNAWDITTGSSSLIISVLDSGIPLSHPEFSGRVLPGYDYANNDNDPTDDQGHGTNVSSIASAKGNNSSLVAGVNWNCLIIPVKILDANNSGFYSWWISGITYAVDHNAKVLNMSVGEFLSARRYRMLLLMRIIMAGLLFAV